MNKVNKKDHVLNRKVMTTLALGEHPRDLFVHQEAGDVSPLLIFNADKTAENILTALAWGSGTHNVIIGYDDGFVVLQTPVTEETFHQFLESNPEDNTANGFREWLDELSEPAIRLPYYQNPEENEQDRDGDGWDNEGGRSLN